MSDPWPDFLREAPDEGCIGYFERGVAPGLPGRWAFSFTEPEEIWSLRPDSTVEQLDESTRKQLRSDPRRALVGYVGFEATALFEPLLRRGPSGSPYPLGEWAVVHRFRRRRVPSHTRPSRRRQASCERPEPTSDTLPQTRFERSVRRLRTAIRRGDAFQVVLSHRRAWRRPDDLLLRASLLRARERFAYFYYLRFHDREVLGASPESVLEVEGRRAFVSPIAATRPRRPTDRPGLRQDRKELAEHRMLVDLARNDLGRVSAPGTVRLDWEERLVRFARLEHLVSRVEGTLPRGTGPWAALAAAFPAGTVSGAPKIRATQLIRQEERTWRGPYGGAVGLVRGDGDAAWGLTIRSAFTRARTLYTAAGAGILWHSQPRREFDETLLKLEELEGTLVGGRP